MPTVFVAVFDFDFVYDLYQISNYSQMMSNYYANYDGLIVHGHGDATGVAALSRRGRAFFGSECACAVAPGPGA